MALTYSIINIADLDKVDFSQVNESSENTLRYSIDESKTFVKFEGVTPSFLEGKTIYNHNEILEILNGSEWNEEIE